MVSEADKIQIEENTQYVLGMYDLYPNDQDIIKALKAKGLSSNIIEEILHRVKQPAYSKRLKQSKKQVIIGLIAFIVLFLIPYLFIHFSHSSPEQELLAGGNRGDTMFRTIYKLYKQFYIFIILLFIIQITMGISSFLKYKKLLSKNIESNSNR